MPSRYFKTIFRTLLLSALLSVGLVQTAHADFGFQGLTGALTGSDGSFSRQAGAHADLNTRIEFNHHGSQIDDNVRDVRVDLPEGFVGNPLNAPTCKFTDLIVSGTGVSECPTASQVGFAEIFTGPEVGPGAEAIRTGVYNMPRPGDAPALFAFNYTSNAVTIEPRIRPGDYGISAYSVVISQAVSTFTADVTLWGVPADPVHDFQRIDDTGTIFGVPSPDTPKPFLSNPTSCPGVPATFTASIDSWQNQGAFLTRSFDRDRDGTPFLFTGCEDVPFDPAVALRSSSQVAQAPTGLDVELKVPQNESAYGLAAAQVRKTVLTLPKAFTLSPSAASGQGACSEAQIGIGSAAAPTCPDSSRIGTVAIQTPVLDEVLEGSLYLAEQRNNPFGSMFAAYLAVKGPGFYLKLPGKIEADANDGQLTTTFDNLPQLPFETASISLRQGSGAPLLTPSACGTYQAQVQMTSWASPDPVTLSAPLTIDQGCDTGGFGPTLSAGTVNPLAGAYSPFLLRVTRRDGEQNIDRIDATLPKGLLAKLAGVPLCEGAAASSGNCPAASQVGTTTVAVGAGPAPLYVPEPGRSPTAVYLAGPYKGAPLSLVVKVPAQAGPFDLGTVSVRNALEIDPITTQASVRSDPLPQILEGIPISYRDIRVEINRPDFTLNPTNCSRLAVTSVLTSSAGQTAQPSAPFAAANCERLAFKPSLALRVFGKPTRNAKPRLRAVLQAKPGEANIARAQVNLPHSLFLEQNHIKTVCTRVQWNEGAGHGTECPAGSIYGRAQAVTPLLDQPLQGPVYLRSSSHKLPDLVAALNGQVDIELSGRVDSGQNNGLRNTFEVVPDAPVSKFILEMKGGKKGLLVNSENLCSRHAKRNAIVRFTGQNGKVEAFKPKVAASCGNKKKAKKGGA